MRKFCEFTKETGEAVWVNPLRIRLVYASHAGSRIAGLRTVSERPCDARPSGNPSCAGATIVGEFASGALFLSPIGHFSRVVSRAS
jgi:hypothetical protein